MVGFTIGCDPELFLKNRQGNFISAVGLIGGSKWEPKLISPDGHAIQEDNVSVEFNIPPSASKDAFVRNINFVLDHLDEKVKTLGLSFAVGCSAKSFDIDQLNTPEAQAFGCEPDFNAWTGKVNPKPFCIDQNLRSAGGHVHVGTQLEPVAVIRAMDLFLGVPSVTIDGDNTRRQLYGKAGAFRPKVYGCEYRTLSNFWIWSDAMKEWVYNQTEKALNFVQSGKEISKHGGMLIRRAINSSDMHAVKLLNKAHNLGIPNVS